jgi:Gpi18-like mannosyltransferase
MKKMLLLVLSWIIIVNVFGFVAENRLNLNADTAYIWITPQNFPPVQNWDLIDMHNRWDSYWYLDIVENGYYVRTDNTLSNVAFFPLYPMLIWLLGTLLLGHFVLAGWILSMGFLLLAARYFYKLVEEFHPAIDPRLPILFMLAFPTAFFFTVVYTESLFLFLTLACFYHTFRKQFLLAGLFAFFGALAHSNGIFLAIPILWELWRIYGWKVVFTKKILPVFFPAIATIGFFAYSALKFHDLFLFFKLESAWGRSFSLNKSHFLLFSHPSIVNLAIDCAFTVIIIGAIVLVYRRLSPLYAIYMSATVLAALTSGTLMSIGRYSLVLFPLFILLASVKNESFRIGWLFASTLFLAQGIILFVSNSWAG